MFSISTAELEALLFAWGFPMARILGLVGAAPIFNSKATPMRVRLGVGVLLTLAIVPGIPAVPQISPGSWQGLLIFAQQILIGLCMGLVMRIVMSAVDIAGEIIGMQMGLSFATFFDPDTQAQTAVIGEFLGLLATLLFLAINGHLLIIHVLARSFELAPIGFAHFSGKVWLGLLQVAGLTFASGLLLAMPIIATMLITNIALGVLTRTAPQLNIFAVGFPVTSTVGLIVIMVSLQAMAPAIEYIFNQGFELVSQFLMALNSIP